MVVSYRPTTIALVTVGKGGRSVGDRSAAFNIYDYRENVI